MERSRIAGYALLVIGLYSAAFLELMARSQGLVFDPFKWWLHGLGTGSQLGNYTLLSAIAYFAVFTGLVYMSLGWSRLGALSGYYGLLAPLVPPLTSYLLSVTHLKLPALLNQAPVKDMLYSAYLSSPLFFLGLGLAATTSSVVGIVALLYSFYDASWSYLGLPGPSTPLTSRSFLGLGITLYEAVLYYTASAALIYMGYELALARRAAREQAAEKHRVLVERPSVVQRVTKPKGPKEVKTPPTPRNSAPSRSDSCRGVRLSELARNRREVVERCLVGREIHGYVVEEFIGSGGFGVVLRAHAREDPGDKAAIKLLVPLPPPVPGETTSRLVRDVLVVARDLEREAMSLRELSEKSPYVARLRAIHIDSERLARAVREDSLEIYMVSPPAIIMEYLGGGSLVGFLEEARRRRVASPNNPSWVRVVAAIGAVVAKALAHVHGSGYVHGDMKPENILFTSKPPVEPARLLPELQRALLEPERADIVPKLSDLGAAVKIGSPVVQLTPGYAAPELEGYDLVCNELGKKTAPICTRIPVAEPSQDTYSLGMILLQLLTGMKQKQLISFKHTRLCRIDYEKGMTCSTEQATKLLRRSSAEKLAPLLEKMLSTNPGERPAASQVAACLACIASHEPSEWSTCNKLCPSH